MKSDVVRRSSRLSVGVRSDVVRDLLSFGTFCARKYECFLQFFDSNLFGLEPVDVNF